MYACLFSIPLASSAVTEPTQNDLLFTSATGPSFYQGDTEFRLVPGALAVSSDTVSKSESLSRRTNAATSSSGEQKEVAQVGDYLIILPSASSELKSQVRHLSAAKGSANAASYAVAVSESSGLPVLVRPSVTVYTSPSVAKDLANKTGGNIVYSSELAGRAVIGYADVDTAINALATLTANNGTKASLDIIESFNQPQ